MPDMLTKVYFFILALISFVVATIAIVWLSIVRKHLSTLGKRLLEFEDIGRVIQAADSTASFESRMAGCEKNTEENNNQLAEHETTINEIDSKVREVGQMIKKHAVDLANTSEKIASFERRFDDFENNIGGQLSKLVEHETKVNELAAKLESVEQTANKNEAGLAEVNTSVSALTDKIEILEKFRTIVEKTHSIIQAAFSDMRASTAPEKGLGVSSEIAKPEEVSRWSQDEQDEATDQETIETEAYHYP